MDVVGGAGVTGEAVAEGWDFICFAVGFVGTLGEGFGEGGVTGAVGFGEGGVAVGAVDGAAFGEGSGSQRLPRITDISLRSIRIHSPRSALRR